MLAMLKPIWSPFRRSSRPCYPMLSCWPRRTRRSRVVQLTLVVSNVALSDRAPQKPDGLSSFPVFPLKWPLFFFPAPMFRHTCISMFKNHIWDDDPQRLLWLIQGLQTTYQQNTVSGHKNEPETNYSELLKLNDFNEMSVPAARTQLLKLTNVASSLCLAS